MIPQDKYDEIISLIPIVCVDVAIVYDNKILLIKRRDEPAKGEWWLPGGRLYKGETLTDCALRKAKEETGLHCEVGPMIHYASTDFGTVHSVNLVYLLFASDDRARLDDTCLDYKWIVENQELSFYDYNDYVHHCLLKAFDYLQVGISAYDDYDRIAERIDEALAAFTGNAHEPTKDKVSDSITITKDGFITGTIRLQRLRDWVEGLAASHKNA